MAPRDGLGGWVFSVILILVCVSFETCMASGQEGTLVLVALASAFMGGLLVVGTLEAPISGRPCVAFRVVGTTDEARVDDAGAVPFTVLTDEGERLRVLAPPARIEIATRRTARGEGAEERLRRFLAPRGVRESQAPVEEGCLVDGDRVSISGTPTEDADPAAATLYRETVFVGTLVDAPGGELIITRRTDAAPRPSLGTRRRA